MPNISSSANKDRPDGQSGFLGPRNANNASRRMTTRNCARVAARKSTVNASLVFGAVVALAGFRLRLPFTGFGRFAFVAMADLRTGSLRSRHGLDTRATFLA
jgi:hypothetical protein